MTKSKKITALAMAAALMLGGKSIGTKAASQSGVLELPAPRASASGTYGSVNWTASLSLLGDTAVATTSTNGSARVETYITATFTNTLNPNGINKSADAYDLYYSKATVSMTGFAAGNATSRHIVQSHQVTTLSEK